jgi:uncharacterized damage-inducible protein DinB
MKTLAVVLGLCLAASAQAQTEKKPVTLRSVLLDQLHSTHDKKNWYVDADTAVANLTAEQSNWTDGKGNHSVGQLVNHLVFWNRQSLANFKGETPEKFGGNNDETFTKFDSKQWKATVQALDEVLTQLEKLVELADDKSLEKWAPTLANIGAHNAYHIGQVVFVRREQGSWDAEKGVK